MEPKHACTHGVCLNSACPSSRLVAVSGAHRLFPSCAPQRSQGCRWRPRRARRPQWRAGCHHLRPRRRPRLQATACKGRQAGRQRVRTGAELDTTTACMHRWLGVMPPKTCVDYHAVRHGRMQDAGSLLRVGREAACMHAGGRGHADSSSSQQPAAQSAYLWHQPWQCPRQP